MMKQDNVENVDKKCCACYSINGSFVYVLNFHLTLFFQCNSCANEKVESRSQENDAEGDGLRFHFAKPKKCPLFWKNQKKYPHSQKKYTNLLMKSEK